MKAAIPSALRETWRPALSWLLGVGSLAYIVWSEVLPAARRIATDFSNYYIPARLIARGASTARLYEFSWFQRQMEYAGIHDALGGFNYFPPPAALPLIPLGGLDAVTAKTVWTAANLVMLVALLLVLRRTARLPLAAGLTLAALSGSSLRDNFLFGQFYIALTLLVAVALLLMLSGRTRGAGALLGIGTALKLYPAPFLVYFIARRDWRAVSAFLGAIAVTYAASIGVLGWPLHEHYFQSILPASLAGQTDTPFHPALQSWTSVLRVLLVREPTLNPHPLLDAPFVFHLLRDASLLALLALLVYTIRDRGDAAALSLTVLALLLLSTSAFSYHTFLAIIPVGCWMPELWRRRRWATLATSVGLYMFAVSPYAAAWPTLHLRLCALAALFFLLLRELQPWRLPRAVAVAIALVSLAHATWAVRPHAQDNAVPVAWDAFHIESPTAARDALVYSALGCPGCRRYQLRGTVPPGVPDGHQLAPAFARDGRALFVEMAAGDRSRIVLVEAGAATDWSSPDQNCGQPDGSGDGTRMVAVCDKHLFLFDAPGRGHPLPVGEGEVADPALSPDGARVAFARLSAGHWHLCEVDAAGGAVRPLVAAQADERGPRYSPDGAHLVFSRRVGGWDALWIRDLSTGAEQQVSRGTGNDNQPAWSEDGRSVFFASDRGRGIFMPAIYRLDLTP